MPRLRGLLLRLDGVLFEPEADRESTILRHHTVAGASDLLGRCFSRHRLGCIADAGDLDASAVRDVLVALDWHGYFETVATPIDIGCDADSPAMVRAALSSMGVLPGDAAVVVRDRPQAALGANSAGAHVICIGDAPARERLDRVMCSVASPTDVPDALRRIENDEVTT